MLKLAFRSFDSHLENVLAIESTLSVVCYLLSVNAKFPLEKFHYRVILIHFLVEKQLDLSLPPLKAVLAGNERSIQAGICIIRCGLCTTEVGISILVFAHHIITVSHAVGESMCY